MATTSFFGSEFFAGGFFEAPVAQPLRGGHFGFDEKHRDKRWKKEQEEEDARRERLHTALYGLPPAERELVTSAPEQTIAVAAKSVTASKELMARIAAVMEEQQDENDIVEMFMKGEL